MEIYLFDYYSGTRYIVSVVDYYLLVKIVRSLLWPFMNCKAAPTIRVAVLFPMCSFLTLDEGIIFSGIFLT